MAVIICNINDCKHRSKRPLKNWRGANDCLLYGCTLKRTVISRTFDPDGDIEAVAGRDNTAICFNYEIEEGH